MNSYIFVKTTVLKLYVNFLPAREGIKSPSQNFSHTDLISIFPPFGQHYQAGTHSTPKMLAKSLLSEKEAASDCQSLNRPKNSQHNAEKKSSTRVGSSHYIFISFVPLSYLMLSFPFPISSHLITFCYVCVSGFFFLCRRRS